MTSLKMNAAQVFALMDEVFPIVASMGFRIDALEPHKLTLSRHSTEEDIRPGGTVSGISMMTLADTAAYFLVLAHIGPEALAVTTNLNINFLRKPHPGEMLVEARMLKLGSRLAVVELGIFNAGKDDPVAHATVTYSIPPNDALHHL